MKALRLKVVEERPGNSMTWRCRNLARGTVNGRAVVIPTDSYRPRKNEEIAMKTVIVYESMFGNTEHIARQVADGLAKAGNHTMLADVREIGRDDLAGSDLMVVGAPTHAFSLSRQSTREDAVRQGADPSHAAFGVREWLNTLDEVFPAAAERPRVAVFDTRVEKARRLPGSAAKRAAKILRGNGFDVLDRPTSFYVADVKGPATSGELDRAHDWGTRLFELTRSQQKRHAS